VIKIGAVPAAERKGLARWPARDEIDLAEVGAKLDGKSCVVP
jgi:hypothetical protein